MTSPEEYASRICDKPAMLHQFFTEVIREAMQDAVASCVEICNNWEPERIDLSSDERKELMAVAEECARRMQARVGK